MLIKCRFLLIKPSKSPIKRASPASKAYTQKKSQVSHNQRLKIFYKISKIYLNFAASEKWQSGRMRRS